MSLAGQWDAVENGLDPRWRDAHLTFTLDDETRAERALALLGPTGPGRTGRAIRFFVTRTGRGIGPEAIRRLVRRLDTEGITGTLTLVAADEAPPEPEISRPRLSDAWDAALAVLPTDWSDLLCELELTSSDHIDRAALLLAPVNPLQSGLGKPGFRFRVAHTFGYGASAGMVRRCVQRLDDNGIPGELRVLHALSDTHPVGTQGPVWYVGGKTT
jgi:catechol 2,3-dioxygenase-like lactoylglutathione lyase family enzyme